MSLSHLENHTSCSLDAAVALLYIRWPNLHSDYIRLAYRPSGRSGLSREATCLACFLLISSQRTSFQEMSWQRHGGGNVSEADNGRAVVTLCRVCVAALAEANMRVILRSLTDGVKEMAANML